MVKQGATNSLKLTVSLTLKNSSLLKMTFFGGGNLRPVFRGGGAVSFREGKVYPNQVHIPLKGSLAQVKVIVGSSQ